ncbi:MAG: hypothetical protein RR735_09735 [Bacteroidales bacterium]
MNKLKSLQYIGLAICLLNSGIAFTQEYKNYALTEIQVCATVDPLKIMKNAAKKFAVKYSKNSVSHILQYRTVCCNNKYCEFNAYLGVIAFLDFNQNPSPFFWNNPANNIRIAPLSVFRSSAFDYNGNELELSGINSNGNPFRLEHFNLGYINKPIGNALAIKRSLEIYSPLNPKMIPYFSYIISKMFKNKEEDQFAVIEFETNKDYFPAKCRLLGKGSILYNISKQSIESIKMSDFIDFYSTAARVDFYNGKSATRPSIEVVYENIDGNLFTKSIFLQINWKKPDNIGKDDFIYSIINNARRNPFKYNLAETEYCIFSNSKLLNKQKTEHIKNLIYNSYRDPGAFYTAPYIPELWRTVQFKGIPLEKIKKDLTINGKTIEQQALQNGLNGFEIHLNSSPAPVMTEDKIQQYLKFSKQYYIITKEKIIPCF